jgi:hypothetical protein
MRPHRWDKPRTDLGTIILHWLVAGALSAAVASGIAIGCTRPGHEGIGRLGSMWPSCPVWAYHMVSASMLIVIAIVYPIYISSAGLVRRIVLDRVRLSGFGRARYRWAAWNVILHWGCYLTIVAELASGGLVLIGATNPFVIGAHRIGSWAVVGYLPLHVLTHFAYGGLQQLLRVFRPVALSRRRPARAPMKCALATDLVARDDPPGDA